MKNTLAENLLRFGVKNLSEADMKKLHEQTAMPAPKLTGTAANALLSVPNIQVTTATTGAGAGKTTLNTMNLDKILINYLGGDQSYLAKILNRNVLIFNQPVYKLAKQETGVGVDLPNENTDKLIPYIIQPKAWYVGYASGADNKIAYIYLFDKPVTTNYSGNPAMPWIGKNGNPTNNWNEANPGADLIVKPQADGTPYYENSVESLMINPKAAGSAFNVYKVRTYDGAVFLNNSTQTPIGYADYITALGSKIGTMQGVTTI